MWFAASFVLASGRTCGCIWITTEPSTAGPGRGYVTVRSS
jgi:hypothetical protein